MSEFERPGATMDPTTRRRPATSLFGDLSERLSRTFGSFDRPRAELPAWDPASEFDYPPASETVAWEPQETRFPIARSGYDCGAVDDRLDELERELAHLKGGKPVAGAVAAELDRLGEQTAAILQTAYEQAAEITRSAREQADKCLADAAANALAMTEDANRRLRELDVETDSVWQERSRLIDDARGVATSLFALAEEAAERFPSEAERMSRESKPGQTVAVAPTPVPQNVAAAPAPVSAQVPEGGQAPGDDQAPAGGR